MLAFSHLRKECCNPNNIINRIGEHSAKYVPLSMNFPSVDFVE